MSKIFADTLYAKNICGTVLKHFNSLTRGGIEERRLLRMK